MSQWAYRVEHLSRRMEDRASGRVTSLDSQIAPLLESAGQAGWELVSTVPTFYSQSSSGDLDVARLCLVLKRPL